MKFVALMLVVGCVGCMNAGPIPEGAVRVEWHAETLRQWAALGLPSPIGRCETPWLIEQSTEEFEDWAHMMGTRGRLSCARLRTMENGIARNEMWGSCLAGFTGNFSQDPSSAALIHMDVTLRPNAAWYQDILVHEQIHALTRCLLDGDLAIDYGDADHSGPQWTHDHYTHQGSGWQELGWALQ